MSRRLPALALWITVLVLSGTLGAAGPAVLTGRATDALGNLLEGVEVLILSHAAAATDPIATTHSDPEGRFSITGLLPGSYRIAAVKQGYLTFIGEFDTLVGKSIDLVLEPARRSQPDGAGAPLPRDPAWVLRAPRRSLWRETDPQAPLGDPVLAEASDEGLRMQLDQLFSLHSRSSAEPQSSAELRATETTMKVSTGIGERGRLAVRGQREAIGSSVPGSSAAALDRRATAVVLDMAYAPSDGAELAVNAFYGAKHYEAASEAAAASLDQSQQAWGYDAVWAQQLGDKSRWALELGYVDTSLGGGGGPSAASDAGQQEIASQAMTAQGSFERLQDERHALQVALRAQHARLSTLADPRLVGWNFQVDAQDSWTVAAPFKLVYGLSCTQALSTSRSSQDATLIVPRMGGAFAWEGFEARASMSYHAVAGGGTAAGTLEPFRPEHRVGYDAAVDLPVGAAIRLEGGTRYTPVQFDVVGRAGAQDGFDPHPLYVTDGNAAVREHRLSLVGRCCGSVRTFLELAAGRAQGTLATLMPFDVPVELRESELRFRNARFGLHLPAIGTDMQLEYSHSEGSGDQPADDAQQQAVELRLAQDLWGLKARTEWRLLMALQLTSVDTAGLDPWLSNDGDRRALDALNRRLSAGVSVAF